MADLIIRGQRVYTPKGAQSASIHISGRSIESVREYDQLESGVRVVDAGELPVFPGLVDTHVHINEPGRTEWEGFETATRAAAAGGVTTLVDMPLNSIPATTSVEGLEAKIAATRGQLWVDVGFWGGVVPGNTGELAGLVAGGVLGFKCFLTPSGVDEFPHVADADLREAAPELARLGAVLLAHAESPERLRPVEGDGRVYGNYLRSRPREAEQDAIARLIALNRSFGVRAHIVHLSSADALPLLLAARAEGLAVTVETCPHYLAFAAEEIADGATEFKCAPPIRERENRERLWAGLVDGTIDLVVTDHSPCPPSMKAGDFAGAWGGIASVQLSLGVMWRQLQRRGLGAEWIAQWMSAAPARLAGLRRKGRIAAGFDADLAIWNPEGVIETLHHRHKVTPYRAGDYSGAVEATYLRGHCVYERGSFLAGPAGEILRA